MAEKLKWNRDEALNKQ